MCYKKMCLNLAPQNKDYHVVLEYVDCILLYNNI